MIQIVLLSGNWRFNGTSWKFLVDERGSREVGVEGYSSLSGIIETVYEVYGVEKMNYIVELSYMISKEVLVQLGANKDPVFFVNDGELQAFFDQFKGKTWRLCVSFKKPTTRNDSEKCITEEDLKDDESEEEGPIFDYCDDSDGASSGDEDYELCERVKKVEECVEPKKKKALGKSVQESVDDENYQKIELAAFDIAVGQRYDSKDALVKRLQLLSIAKKFDFNRVDSRPDLLIAKCWVEGCTWRVRAGTVGDSPSFYIKVYVQDHSCSVTERGGRCRQATKEILGELYYDSGGRVGPGVIPDHVAAGLNFKFGIKINYWKAHRALVYARILANGSHESGYEELPSYLYLIRRANPGTFTRLAVDEDGRFKSLFISFGASINGFHFMRKVVVVDGTFLKGRYKGTLLVATCQDGNFQIFPIAFAVVDTENDVSWEWFFKQLSCVFPDHTGLSIISDRHKSIAKAIAKVYPLASRGICTYHMYKNILVRFKGGDAFRLVKKAANAYRISDFNVIFNEIQDLNPLLHAYLENADVKVWSRAHFPGQRYNILTSNIAESINRVLSDARTLPIVKLLDAIRSMLTRWFLERRRAAEEMRTRLTDRVEKLLEPRVTAARLLVVQEIDADQVHVTNGRHSHVVNVKERTCSCRRFDVHQLPCVHAIAAGVPKKITTIGLSSPYYFKSYLINAYAPSIMPRDVAHPVPAKVATQQCLPPIVRKPPGRPKNSRFKSALEKALENKRPRKQNICSNCNQTGHNSRTCGR